MVYKPQKLASTDGGTGIGSYTKGDILVSDVSGKLSKLSVGTDGYALVADSAQTTGLRYANSASALFGLISQQVYTSNSTYATYVTAIPLDDTIPAITDGTQIMSASITPNSATSTLEIEAIVCASGGGGTMSAVVAIYNNSNTCIAVATAAPKSTSQPVTIPVKIQVSAGATTAQTFKVRVGPSAGTLYLNGDNSSRLFGGVLASTLTIKEYAP